MSKLIFILLTALMFEAVGVVFLSKGLKQIGELRQVSVPEIARLISRGLTNPNILLGVMFEAIFFAGLLYLLSKRDVSVVWPLTALGFVVTTIAAKLFLHEHVSSLRWAGVSLIVLGAALITLSDRAKPAVAQPEPTPPASGQSRLD